MAISYASAGTDSAADILETLYPQDAVEEIICKANPTFGMIKKVDDFEGDGTINFSVQYGTQQGVSGSLSNASTNKSANLYERFVVTRGKLYGLGTISGELIRASKSNKASLVRSLDGEMKGLLNQFNRYLSLLTFSNGGGALGRIGSISGDVITLATTSDVVWFEKNQTLKVSSADGTSGSMRAGSAVVTAVNRRTGEITTDGLAGITGETAGDYIFQNGLSGVDVTLPTGLSGWIPLADPSATSFFGVDRSVDTARLGGLRYLAGAGGPIEETLQAAMAYFYQESAKPDTAIFNPIDMQNLLISLGSKVRLESASRSAYDMPTVGYKGVKIASPFGEVECFSDPGCQKGRAYFLTLDDWEWHTMGAFPGFLKEDGTVILRDASADTYSFRLGAFGNLVCTAPGRSGVVQLLPETEP
jgi:hypothetical protein